MTQHIIDDLCSTYNSDPCIWRSVVFSLGMDYCIHITVKILRDG